MISPKPLAVALAVLASLAGGPLPAAAEWFADLFIGAAFTETRDLDIKASGPSLTGRATLRDADFDTSVSVGGRFGYWFESTRIIGLGFDVSHFRPNIGRQNRVLRVCIDGSCVIDRGVFEDFDLKVTAIAFDLLLRWPLFTSSEFPKGQLQPYLAVGPAIFMAHAEDSKNFADPRNQSDGDAALGAKVGAGLLWQFHKHLALFAEYRFTHFSPEFEFRPPGFKATLESDINTHHLLGGLSVRF